MQVAVKMPHIETPANALPEGFLEKLRALTHEYFGVAPADVVVEACDDDELISVEDSEWFQATIVAPGSAMRHYREIHDMTQEALGKKLGGIGRQDVSKMEKGRRPISGKTAKKLSKVFDVSVERFI